MPFFAKTHTLIMTGLVVVSVVSPVFAAPQQDGQWSEPFGSAWPISDPTNLLAIPDGRVVSFGLKEGTLDDVEVNIWDPDKGTDESSHIGIDHNLPRLNSFFTQLLADGKIFLATGLTQEFTSQGDGEVNSTYVFDPQENTFTQTAGSSLANQETTHYYTTVLLSNGEVLMTGGSSLSEIYSPVTDQWRQLTNAFGASTVGESGWVLPNGEVFVRNGYLDLSGEGNFTSLTDDLETGLRTRSWELLRSSVMYRADKFFIPSTTTAASFNERSLHYRDLEETNEPATFDSQGLITVTDYTSSSIVLPTGNVLTARTVAPGAIFQTYLEYPRRLELWDANTEVGRFVAENDGDIGDHIVLMLDGSVLITSGDEGKPQKFFPPYLFDDEGIRASRPNVVDAPSQAANAEKIVIRQGDSDVITRVTLVNFAHYDRRENSVGQRFLELEYTDTSEGLNVTLPASSNVALPGHYMIFLINDKGVPSEAHVIQLIGESGAAYPVASPDSVTVTSGMSIAIDALANDTGASLSLNPPSAWSLNGGSVELSKERIVYTPKLGFVGEDKVWYTVVDAQGRSNYGEITITVEENASTAYPIANSDYITVSNSDMVTIDPLANDIGNALTLNPPNEWSLNGGAVTLNGNKLTYTPKAGFTGEDKIWYTIVDALGRSTYGEITITVTNDKIDAPYPTAVTDYVAVKGSSETTIDALANDIGVGLAFDYVNHWSQHGGAVTTIDNKIGYTPKLGFNGEDKVWYNFADSQGRLNFGEIIITVSGN